MSVEPFDILSEIEAENDARRAQQRQIALTAAILGPPSKSESDQPTVDIPKLVAWAATVAFCVGFWTGVVLLVVSGA